MTCEIIRCSLLFDAIREKKSKLWLANTILMLDIRHEAKIKVAEQLLQDEDAFDWFMEQLEEDEKEDDSL